MLHDPSCPNDFEVFLESWEAELRGGYTPPEDLDTHERLCEYLDDSVSDAEVEALDERLRTWTMERQRQDLEDEARWPEVTDNDALTDAFRALDARGIFARERLGLTLEDGWARVGLDASARHFGAVFFHSFDVFDALTGWPLLLAFDTTGDAPATEAERVRVAEVALDTLSAHGLRCWWSEHPDDRIQLAPFEWRRRRHSVARPGARRPACAASRSGRPNRLEVDPTKTAPFVFEDYARRTTYGYDANLAYTYRGVWVTLGGERGQPGSLGMPHTFLRAGELHAWVPRDAYVNASAAVGASIRREARARTG